MNLKTILIWSRHFIKHLVCKLTKEMNIVRLNRLSLLWWFKTAGDWEKWYAVRDTVASLISEEWSSTMDCFGCVCVCVFFFAIKMVKYIIIIYKKKSWSFFLNHVKENHTLSLSLSGRKFLTSLSSFFRLKRVSSSILPILKQKRFGEKVEELVLFAIVKVGSLFNLEFNYIDMYLLFNSNIISMGMYCMRKLGFLSYYDYYLREISLVYLNIIGL